MFVHCTCRLALQYRTCPVGCLVRTHLGQTSLKRPHCRLFEKVISLPHVLAGRCGLHIPLMRSRSPARCSSDMLHSIDVESWHACIVVRGTEGEQASGQHTNFSLTLCLKVEGTAVVEASCKRHNHGRQYQHTHMKQVVPHTVMAQSFSTCMASSILAYALEWLGHLQ